MNLCDCINMPQPPGVDPNHECVEDYNDRNEDNCENFKTICQNCGNDENCKRAARDLYIQACLGSIYQLAVCLAEHGIDPPSGFGSWNEWQAAEGEEFV